MQCACVKNVNIANHLLESRNQQYKAVVTALWHTTCTSSDLLLLLLLLLSLLLLLLLSSLYFTSVKLYSQGEGTNYYANSKKFVLPSYLKF